jgi:hypothetical protein
LILDEFVIPTGEQCRVLDIGCGPRNLLGFLPKHVRHFGLDVSSEYIESDSERFSSHRDAQFQRGTLQHAEDEIAEEMFALARKKFKPSAKMIVLEPVLFDGQSPLRKWVMTKDHGNNIKPDNGSKTLFSKLTAEWATSNIRIMQNLTRFYDLIVREVIKNRPYRIAS